MKTYYRPNELKTNRVPQYYYHVTEKKLGKRHRFVPLKNNESIYRDWDEPHNTRTCVAPTIEGCLIAVMSCITPKKLYIYRTENKITAKVPKKVVDCKVTDEHWLLHPINFVLHSEMPITVVKAISEKTNFLAGNKDSIPRQVKAKPVFKKILAKNKIRNLE